MATIKKKIRSTIIQKRRRKAYILSLTIIVSTFILLFTASLVFSWQSYFQIQNIEVIGNQVVGTDNIVLASKVALADNYAWIWPKSFFLWYPNDEIKTIILNQFPRVKKIDVNLRGKNDIQLNIVERRPYAVWCDDKMFINNLEAQNCFVLDRNGFIFDRAPKSTGSLFWHFFGEINKGENVGADYLTPDTFNQLANFLDEVSGRGFNIIGLESFFADGYYKLYLSNNVYVLISAVQNFSSTLRNLEVLTSQKDMDLRNADVSSRLEYVDLRFGNKINYKDKASENIINQP